MQWIIGRNTKKKYGYTNTIKGEVFEKGGVNFSYVEGDSLPDAALAHMPNIKDKRFMATGVSLVIHPNNPFVPTSHMNVRFFVTNQAESPVWWFGGGFDLTPVYPFDQDCLHWHTKAKEAVDPFGPECYPKYKKWCDEYFFLPHRQETRGVGGLFFDHLNHDTHGWQWEKCFAFMRAVGDAYIHAYKPIINKRKNLPFTEQHKKFQRIIRGRYVEFNLLYDRGTLFGLQSNGRTESILMSLPLHVSWEYNYSPDIGSAEARLAEYLQPREWIEQN